MAQITVKVSGGNVKEMEAETIGEVKETMGLPNHVATINGEPASDEDELEDFNFVVLSTAVKGGRV